MQHAGDEETRLRMCVCVFLGVHRKVYAYVCVFMCVLGAKACVCVCVCEREVVGGGELLVI